MTLIHESRLFGHLDRLAQLQTSGRTSAPLNCEIDLSNRCSLGCEWCHFAYTHTRGPLKGAAKPEGAQAGGDLMDTDLAHRLIRDLKVAGVRSLTWTGGGEPTLHPDFDAIIDHGALPQGLYTHGGHIDADRAALLKRRMTFVYVSLDAVDADSYRRHKGVDRFEKACEGIRLLAGAKGEATVGLGMLVGPDTTRREIRAAVVLSSSLGADYVQFRPIIAFDVKSPGEPADDRRWVTRAAVDIEEARADLGLYGQVEFDSSRFIAYRDWAGHGYDTCRWSMLQTCVTPDGSVWACVNRREFAGSKLGNLTDESFTAIWARHSATRVDGDCRVMCRGHIGNLELEHVLAPREHAAFV